MKRSLVLLIIALSLVLILLFLGSMLMLANYEPHPANNETTPHTHSFSVKNTSSVYLKTTATCTKPCTYYYSCDCGEKGTDTFIDGDTKPHYFTKEIISDKYLCSEATKKEPAKYYYACWACNKCGMDIFEYGEPLEDRWFYDYYIDYQFGEETDEWYVKTKDMLDGTFENSATNDADLLVELLYDCDNTITIFLYEYADKDNQVKNSSSKYKDYYKIVVKNEKGQTYEARGQMWPGDDRIYIIDTYHDSVLELMKTSETLKFYIECEDSPTTRYRFEVDMSNFNDIVEYIKQNHN